MAVPLDRGSVKVKLTLNSNSCGLSLIKILVSTILMILVSGCQPTDEETQKADFREGAEALTKSDSGKSGLADNNSDKANVLLILTDDQGYGDLGINGNEIIETPTLDELFEQGVNFDRFYVSPVCAPTRASLLTGKHYLSTGVFHVTRGGEKMHASNVTLAERLNEQGYRTGLFGKWHNGLQYPHDPIGQGFDEFYGFSAGHLSEYYDNYLYHNNERVQYQGYVADAITNKAIDFVVDASEKPFFAMLSFNTPHGPFQVPNQYFEKYKNKGLIDVNASIYGMVENIDDNIAKVFNALEEKGELNNTIVLFMSDNGPAFPDGQTRYNAGLKGHKGLVDEGGVRSPLVIHWPSKNIPSQKVIPITQHIDIVPTILSLLDIAFDETHFDGRDLTPLMFNNLENGNQWEDRFLYSHRFRISKDSSADPVHPTPAAIRNQQYLALAGENGKWQLYDLIRDPGQKQNLAEEQVTLLEELKSEYFSWYQQITSEHGPYKTLPIEVGHVETTLIELPAHEGLIKSDLEYQHKAGWSHDWLVPVSQNAGLAYWPLKVLAPGKYRVTIEYATNDGAYGNALKVKVAEKELIQSQIAPFIPDTLSTERQYYTDEAPDLTWGKLDMGELDLTTGQYNFEIMFGTDAQNRSLWVKQVTLHKI
uniref:arylsulfatase n=1 Tax=Ningiella ruwaisensis TaxID=2364274 RepID=UPI0010A038E5|nr:arylsulfatase [Ningiella ruwaisensis]